MANNEKLRIGYVERWNVDRGFGFIKPREGGSSLFVHISSLTQGAVIPTIGEELLFEVGIGRDGKPCAVKVRRPTEGFVPRHASEPINRATQAAGVPSKPDRRVVRSTTPLVAWVKPILFLVVLVSLAFAGFRIYQEQSLRKSLASQAAEIPSEVPFPEVRTPSANWGLSTAPDQESGYRCDGRTSCSQMTSCAEATWFINHCPGTKMDGNHDGVPCEQQWCTDGN